jgi:hypothetical protein
MALGVIAFAYIGGIAMVSGAFIAGLLTSSGFVFTLISRSGGSPPKWQTMAAGIGMIVVAIKYPGGIASAGPALRRFVTKMRSREARRLSTPALEIDVGTLRIDDKDLEDDLDLIDLDPSTSSGSGRRSRGRRRR